MRYVKVHMVTGVILDEVYSDTEITDIDAVLVDDNFEVTANKRYIDGKWETFESEPIKESISEEDELNAEILLNQSMIIAKQEEQDQVLAEILLNQVGGSENV